MTLKEWEHDAVVDALKVYERLSAEAKDVFHDEIMEWQLHPGWVICGVMALGFLLGKFVF